MVTGMAAALAAAFVWTLATRLFHGAGQDMPPLEMNAAKGLTALLLFSLVVAGGSGLGAFSLPGSAGALLLLSGAVGIGLGDTAYFRALQQLGTRRVLLLELLAAPFAALVGWFFLAESMAWAAMAGLGLTLAGVALAVLSFPTQPGRGSSGRSVLWGVAAALCQGLGIVMARHAFTRTPLDASQAAWWRLVGGELLLVLILLWRRQPLAVTTSAGRGGLPKVLAAAVLGTFLGIWLQQAAISQLQAGVAQTLLATAPLFAMGLAALTGRRLGLPAVAGALLALMGVALLASQSG